jgi:hypothetical protein
MTPKSTKRNRYFVFVRVVSWLRLLIAPLFLGYWQLENIFFSKNGETRPEKRRNLNKNGRLHVPLPGGTRLGQTWDNGGTL